MRVSLRVRGIAKKLFGTGFVAVVLLSLRADVAAQNESNSKSLINARAAGTVERMFRGRRQSERTKRVVSRYSRRQPSLVHSLQLDSVEGLLVKNRSTSQSFSSFRRVAYLSYVQDVIDVEELFEIDNSTAAQKLLLFEGLRFSNEHIFKPLAGHLYDEVVQRLRTLRDYTTVGVVKNDSGSLGVQRGLSREERLLEFKVHASARYGLEPRLRFDENLVLRHRPLAQETLLEFSFDF